MKITNIGIALLLSMLAAPAAAGPLTPPGAPAPTMKTLDEVEARTPIHAADIPLAISQPGSYYLAENIQYAGAEDGIHITATDVTIDLNGFTLNGPGNSDSTLFNSGILADSGIVVGVATSSTVVLNGKVANWPGTGIYLPTNYNLIKNVIVSNNGDDGITMRSGRIENCVAAENGDMGIFFSSNVAPGTSVVSGCRLNNNNFGIYMNQPGLVTNNSCSGNRGSGIVTFVDGIRVENNNLTYNPIGIYLNSGAIAIKNTASHNTANFAFQAGSVYGPIVDMTAGGAIPTATNPLANFIY